MVKILFPFVRKTVASANEQKVMLIYKFLMENIQSDLFENALIEFVQTFQS